MRLRVRPLLALEHVALAVALLTGAGLMVGRHWGLGHAHWLDLKLGLIAFLLVPLEAMHAWVNHVWIARGLQHAGAGGVSRDLGRGLALDDMVRTLAVVLLGVAVPLLVWLSVRKPF
jgi:hypothetical protein